MKRTIMLKNVSVPVVLLAAFFLAVSSSYAVNLAAVQAEWTPPDSPTPITMWGFIPDPGSCPAGPVAWELGPTQVVAAGGSLSITLRNCLSEPVSIIIPGQSLPSGGTAPVWTDGSSGPRTDLAHRVRSFVHEAPAGGTATYTWNSIKPGTFLYQSGTHPAKQVHMGLYGALKVGTYPGTSAETMVVFSEIDPALHATQSAATPLNYKPKYYLVNGGAYSAGQAVPVVANGIIAQKNLLIRFLNAGLLNHVPMLQGPHMKILAEDGNLLPYTKNQYSFLLAAGKTVDALWLPTETGTYALYDRSLSLTSNGAPGGGMLVYLDVDVRGFPWEMFIPAIIGP